MRVFLVILVSVFSFSAFAQKDMDTFLDRYYFHGNRNDTVVTNARWVKKDFNGDHRTDFIFCGSLNDASMVLAFMSENGTYSIQKLSTRVDQGGRHSISAGKNYLIVGAYDVDTSSEFRLPSRIDTIAWWKNMFIDRDFLSGKKENIDTIRFRFAGFPRWNEEFVFCRNKQQVHMRRTEPVDTQYNIGFVSYSKVVPKDSIDWIFDFIGRLPVKKYSSSFQPVVGIRDGHSINMEIIFSDGSKKKIFDHMGVGTPGLRLFYDYMWAFRKQTNWVKQ